MKKLLLILPLAIGCADVQTALTDIQIGCTALALGQAVIPAGTPASVVAADVEIGCDILETLDAEVQKIVTAYEADQAAQDAGPPVNVPYTAAPFVQERVRARKAAKRL
jgi:hypothetical protein